MNHWAAHALADVERALVHLQWTAINPGTPIHLDVTIANLKAALAHLESWRAFERREREHSPEQERTLVEQLKASVK